MVASACAADSAATCAACTAACAAPAAVASSRSSMVVDLCWLRSRHRRQLDDDAGVGSADGAAPPQSGMAARQLEMTRMRSNR
eukprot:2975871-Prymnesium_polylepis.1